MPYRAEYGLETVKMMRESFHRAMSLEQHNRFDELEKHLNFFAKYPLDCVRVAVDKTSSTIIGCIVLDGVELEQLYVHVDYQRKGIGSKLMALAKTQSPDRLELFTFNKNIQAQSGHASINGNPWAKTREQLADIRYIWHPKTKNDVES